MDALTDLLGESPAIEAVRESIRRLLIGRSGARRPPSILISGETGTGKGLVARLIHRAGPRNAGPFVDVNCAAIPETLLEAELFGFERGAFTDARRAKPGLFQAAHHGTIFLDEIGLLPDALQAKLLTVLEEQAVRRLGSVRTEPADVWIISATNTDLPAAIRDRKFRADLYHRLAVLTLSLPPLRDRERDILFLAERFLARACGDYGLPPKTLASDAQAALLAYPWPGNVRELANVIERVTLLAESSLVTGRMLAFLQGEPSASKGTSRPAVGVHSQDAATREDLLAVLNETGWNISRTARRLGMSRNTLRARIEKLKLRREPDPPFAPEHATVVDRVPPVAGTSTPLVSGVESGLLHWERRRITLLRVVLVVPEGTGVASESSRALEVLLEKVQSFGGRVEGLSSNGLEASFGLEPAEDAPRRAVHAAMAILKAGERARVVRAKVPSVKIGIHIGLFMVGAVQGIPQITQDARQEASSVLDALVSAAEPDTILASAATAPFLERHFELVPVAGRPGLSQQPCRVVGTAERGLGLWGRLGSFVGRHTELGLLRRSLATALSGRGQVVGVVGEPGVGKSRLLWELIHSADPRDWLVLTTSAASYGARTAYLPVIDLLKAYFAIDPRDDATRIRDKVTGKLLAVDKTFAAGGGTFLTLLDVPVDDPAWLALDPLQRRSRIVDDLKRLLLTQAQVSAVVLAFEDAHWIDAETQMMLDALVDSLPAARMLLLVTYRPDYQHQWTGKTFYTQLRVDPLPAEHAAELLGGLLGRDASLRSLESVLIDWTEGNPFFLEESVRTLVETEVVAGERGGYVLAKPTASIQVPATVDDVLASRIDHLPLTEKRLLQSASVIGRDVPLSLLRAITDIPEDALQRALTHLQAAEFLYQMRLSPDPAYTFKHALTHEVAYASLLPEQGRTLHASVLRAIELRYPERLVEHVDGLAHHAVRGELWDKAANYLRQAGGKAMERSAHREALAFFEKALAALQQLPETRDVLMQGIDVRFDVRTALLPLGGFEQIIDVLREAEALAERLDDRRRLARARLFMSSHLRLVGDYAGAIDMGTRAEAIAAAVGDPDIQVLARIYLGQAYFLTGEYRRGIEFLTRSVECLRGERQMERYGLVALPAVLSRVYLVWCLTETGRFLEGIVRGREALDIAESAASPYSVALAREGLGFLYLRKGDLLEAVTLLERALAEAREKNLQLEIAPFTSRLGSAYVRAGRTADGLALLREALEKVDPMRTATYSHQEVLLGEGLLLAGHLAAARESTAHALELATRRNERGQQAWAFRLLADLAVSAHPLDCATAADSYRRSLALADELGMRPLAALCHLGLGRLHGRTGERQNAATYLTAAAEAFHTMAMTSCLVEAQAELKQHR